MTEHSLHARNQELASKESIFANRLEEIYKLETRMQEAIQAKQYDGEVDKPVAYRHGLSLDQHS